jgi:hypothetical protein
MPTDGRKAEIRSAASAYRVNKVLLGTGSPLAIDHPGRRVCEAFEGAAGGFHPLRRRVAMVPAMIALILHDISAIAVWSR